MTKKKTYVRGHVTKSEEVEFRDQGELKRHRDYAKGVLRKDKKQGVESVREAVIWKFEKCLLSTKEIKGLVNE